MSKTSENLREAISGEYNAAKKYLTFADKAMVDRYPNVAYLFRALAMAEGIHLKNLRQALGENFQPVEKKVKPVETLANVQSGIEGETWEYTTMYPGMIKVVKKESSTEMAKLALLAMEWNKNVEKGHASFLMKALEDLQAGKDAEISQIWICKVCGNLIIDTKPPAFCAVCKHDEMFFELVPR